MRLELEIDERTRVKHLDEKFNYFDDWSQEMFHNDTHLVQVVLCGDLLLTKLKCHPHPLYMISLKLAKL